MLQELMKFIRDEEGASAVEYGLIAGLIAVGLVLVLGILGDQLEAFFQFITDELAGNAGGGAGG